MPRGRGKGGNPGKAAAGASDCVTSVTIHSARRRREFSEDCPSGVPRLAHWSPLPPGARGHLAHPCTAPGERAPMLPRNHVHQGDCIAGLAQLDEGSVDLVFADPPFNIGYDYDVYHDKRLTDEYLAWTKAWGEAVIRALKPAGTFWLAIGDEFAAELKILFQRDLGLTCRSWVVWYYTFGVNCQRKFSRSHAHLFHFVRDRRHFTFNADAIR